MKTAHDICAEAAKLVGGDRANSHGDKELNFYLIACLWNGYWALLNKAGPIDPTRPFDAHCVGDMMELLKIARRHTGSFNPDDYVDAAGYAGCTGEIASNNHLRMVAHNKADHE